jgi:hypothetical protein
MMSPVNLAWMAGAIDYGGRVMVKNNQMRTTAPVVLVLRTRREPVMAHLSKLTGVGIDKDGAWVLTGAGLAIALFSLIPYLHGDHDFMGVYNQIMALEGHTGRGSGAVKATIRRMKALGWPLPPAYAQAIAPPWERPEEPPVTMAHLLLMMEEEFGGAST